MEIYKGASAFAGIAIGKIRFYRKGEYQKSKWTQLILNWIWNPNLWIEL